MYLYNNKKSKVSGRPEPFKTWAALFHRSSSNQVIKQLLLSYHVVKVNVELYSSFGCNMMLRSSACECDTDNREVEI